MNTTTKVRTWPTPPLGTKVRFRRWLGRNPQTSEITWSDWTDATLTGWDVYRSGGDGPRTSDPILETELHAVYLRFPDEMVVALYTPDEMVVAP